MAGDGNASWKDRFEQAFNDPVSERQRKRVNRNSWQQLKYEKKRRSDLEASAWWRATKPGRKAVARVKSRQQRRGEPPAGAKTAATLTKRQAGISARTITVLTTLGYPPPESSEFEAVLTSLESALAASGTDRELLWCAFLAVAGRYPIEDDLLLLESDSQVYGPGHAINSLLATNARRGDAWSLYADIEFAHDVVVDVSQTARIDMHTGIQRVVRETVSRWIAHQDVKLALWDETAGAYRPSQPDELDRIVAYSPSEKVNKLSAPKTHNATILAPHRTTFILPEISTGLRRSLALSSVALWTPCTLSAFFYDFIAQGMPEALGEALRVALGNNNPALRASSRISAISETAAREVRGLSEAAPGFGLPTPEVKAQLLPAVPPPSSGHELPAKLAEFVSANDGPLIVSVSRIEPRKNQITLLRAAAALWAEGLEFKLLFIGWNSTKASAFNAEVKRLQEDGRTVDLISRADEDLLWGAYRTALFSVFISLAEGYGLPAAESLSVGTPVVLSNFGSMAEIGAGGGAQMVDPRNVREVINAMRQLLTDHVYLAQLSTEAQCRDLGDWDDYARDSWAWLVDGQG